jgi:hypothetical protein
MANEETPLQWTKLGCQRRYSRISFRNTRSKIRVAHADCCDNESLQSMLNRIQAMSTRYSVPSLHRANSSRPAPIGRVRRSSVKRRRSPMCARRYRWGMTSSILWPSSSPAAYLSRSRCARAAETLGQVASLQLTDRASPRVRPRNTRIYVFPCLPGGSESCASQRWNRDPSMHSPVTLESVLAQTPQLALVVDESGTIRFASAQACRVQNVPAARENGWGTANQIVAA